MALLSTNHKCTHPCLLLLRRRRWIKILKMMLSSRRTQPPVDCLWSWSHCFQDKLYNSDSLLIILILFYVILLLIIQLWCLYTYGTWSWHTYSYAFGFILKTGCDINTAFANAFLHALLQDTSGVFLLGLWSTFARTRYLLISIWQNRKTTHPFRFVSCPIQTC